MISKGEKEGGRVGEGRERGELKRGEKRGRRVISKGEKEGRES